MQKQKLKQNLEEIREEENNLKNERIKLKILNGYTIFTKIQSQKLGSVPPREKMKKIGLLWSSLGS